MSAAPSTPRAPGRTGAYVLAVLSGAILLFLCLPIAIVVPMSFSSAQSLQFPPPGFSLRWYVAFFDDPRWVERPASQR